jgi:hypothetical protein
MTVRPIYLKIHKNSFHITVVLSILIIMILQVAGCTTNSFPGNRTTTVEQAAVSPAIEKTVVPFYNVKISQSESIHPDYVRMDSDVYVQGETIGFSVINNGSSPLACRWMPSYNLYRQAGTWELLTTLKGNYRIDDYYWLGAGNSTPVQQLSTTDLIPGHYKLVKCGVSREFEVHTASATPASPP